MLALITPETIGIVAVAAIVIFGGAKIPEFARSLGRAKSEFKKGIDEGNGGGAAPSAAEKPQGANDHPTT